MGIKSSIRHNSLPALIYKVFCRVACRVVYTVAGLLPLQNRAVFVSVPDYADNARVFCDYINDDNRFGGIDITWFVSTADAEYAVKTDGFNVIRLRYGATGPKAAFVAARAKYVFFTHGLFPAYYKIPDGQLVVNLWHGCGYKYVHPVNIPFSFALVPGKLFVDIKTRSFSCEREKVLPIGYPRYNLMLNPRVNAECVRRAMGLSLRGKLVLWLPTFRKSIRMEYAEGSIEGELGLPLLRSVDELIELDEKCAELGVCLVVKRHPSQVVYPIENFASKLSNVRFINQTDLASADVDLYELFAASDALVSDYSSAAVDYLLLDKPIAYILDDLEGYRVMRGFCFDDVESYMPGAHVRKLADLTSFLSIVAEEDDPWKDERAKVTYLAHNPCENYCERVVKQVLSSTPRVDNLKSISKEGLL